MHCDRGDALGSVLHQVSVVFILLFSEIDPSLIEGEVQTGLCHAGDQMDHAIWSLSQNGISDGAESTDFASLVQLAAREFLLPPRHPVVIRHGNERSLQAVEFRWRWFPGVDHVNRSQQAAISQAEQTGTLVAAAPCEGGLAGSERLCVVSRSRRGHVVVDVRLATIQGEDRFAVVEQA